MSMSDPLGDMLTRIRNGQRAKLAVVRAPNSGLHRNVLDVLKREGYIRDYHVENEEDVVKAKIVIELKYHDGEPVVRTIKRESKPGRRLYHSVKGLPKFYNGLGIAVLSTSRGVLSDYEARQQNVGGEVLCSIF